MLKLNDLVSKGYIPLVNENKARYGAKIRDKVFDKNTLQVQLWRRIVWSLTIEFGERMKS